MIWGRFVLENLDKVKHWLKQQAWTLFLAGYAIGLTLYTVLEAIL